MPRLPIPPLAAVLGFIDCVNRADLEGLASLMTDDHRLVVLDEPPVVGRAENLEAWRGYLAAHPEYVIYPHHLAADDGRVAVLGTTTGSHLGLPDEEERRLTVLWLAEVVEGALSLWQIVKDTPQGRADLGLTGPG